MALLRIERTDYEIVFNDADGRLHVVQVTGADAVTDKGAIVFEGA